MWPKCETALRSHDTRTLKQDVLLFDIFINSAFVNNVREELKLIIQANHSLKYSAQK